MAGKKDKGKAPSVPAGWKAHWDTESNNWYYENIYTKDTVWEKPTEPAYPIQDVSSIEEGDEAVKLLLINIARVMQISRSDLELFAWRVPMDKGGLLLLWTRGIFSWDMFSCTNTNTIASVANGR
ncbi:hypothetical protein DL98DRAFT_219605 [Cadophora sp. DSE1049]|nr:hypothetical protein DL98DRAFT_219605 [Cadophora sp. DSE1049]